MAVVARARTDHIPEIESATAQLLAACSYLSASELEGFKRAISFATQAHSRQRRRSGEPYISHPLAVAAKLAEVRMDASGLSAATLHDVVEDTGVSLEEISQRFGEEVAQLVDGVTKLGNIKVQQRQELLQAWNFQKLALATARDLRVILIKLADRLHNMETIEHLPVAKRRRIALETMEIYIPIASRLGIDDFRQSLEEYCLRAVYPMRYFLIAKAAEQANKKTESYLELIRVEIDQGLAQSDIRYRLLARKKSISGIYAKMAPRYSRWLGDKSEERRSFKAIMDIHGFRVLTASVDDCYRVLGLLHQLFPPIAGRFKDFIAVPKSNGYQSLHTSLLGRFGHPIEVQIRTEDMEEVASKGIAAHGRYKETNPELAPAANWFSRAQSWRDGAQDDPVGFVRNAKLDLYADEILVFSPKGDLYSLPKGATVVDFAYAIHTDIGNKCVGCKIDGEDMPLNAKLENNQRVEIITDPAATPHPYWANFVATSKALVNINETVHKQRRLDAEALGTRLLEAHLLDSGINLGKVSSDALQAVARQCGQMSWLVLLEQIGRGVVSSESVAHDLGHQLGLSIYSSMSKPLLIGPESLAVSYGQCCYPIPGDRIVAASTKGKGIVVHQGQCHNIRHRQKHREKILPATWDGDIKGDFRALLVVNQGIAPQIITRIASEITQQGGGVEKLETDVRNVNLRVVKMMLSVRNRQHLANIIRRLRNIKGIKKIIRPLA